MRLAINQNLYGNYRNRKFSDIWSDSESFIEDYHSSGIPAIISDTSATTLFWLLYARYGNSTVASSDENQFKYKVFSNIFMYGPTWEKRLDIQSKIRELYDTNGIEAFQIGGKAIYNTALNPNQPIANGEGAVIGEGTNTLDELSYINSQNTTNYKKSAPEAYLLLNEILKTDVTEDFIGRFKKLFLTVVSPELPLWYVSDAEESIEIGDDNDN